MRILLILAYDNFITIGKVVRVTEGYNLVRLLQSPYNVLYEYQKHDRRNGGPLRDAIIYAYYCADFTIEGESYGTVAHKANELFDELRRKF